MSNSEQIDRRTMLKQMSAITVGTLYERPGGRRPPLQKSDDQPADGASKFFPGFKTFKFQTPGATINGVIGGQGPPLLLLHGAPQSHITWRLVAPKLMTEYTMVIPDLRGYGDSSKPPDGENHANYSKRAMALDHVEVMKHFGYDKFPVVGHDRGGRVAHRMALDHPDKVTKLAVFDIIPTYYLYTHVTIEFVQAYFHWFNYLRPAPGPENDLKAGYVGRQVPTDPVQAEYFRVSSDPAAIHAMCEDYRAGASIDLKHDQADLDHKIACPLMALWGERSPVGRLYDVLSIWKERATKVTGKALSSGHSLQEEAPDQVIAEARIFLRS